MLLDEPTVGVDPQSRDRIYDMLAELAADGRVAAPDHAPSRGGRGALLADGDHRSRPGHRRGHAAGAGRRTVGRHRLVTLRLDAPLADAPPGVREPETDATPRPTPTRLRARLTDVAAELPPLLERVRAAGRAVEDVDVRGPSLQAVFIHLTGRELRE